MWKVTKFYKGRKAVAVENIDQGRMLDMMFGEVFPQMDADPNWTVSVQKI